MNNVVFTKVSFFRNLKDYKFVPKLTDEKKAEIIEKIDASLDKELLKLDMNNLDSKTRDYLVSNELLNTASSTMFISKDNVVISLFNGEHLTITASNIGYDESVYLKAKTLVDILSNKISMAYNDTYGYLMSDIAKVGSGLKLECQINLHAINTIGKINQVKQNIKNLGFNLKDKSKDIYSLSTICNLGISSIELAKEFEKMINKLQDLELESAKLLASTNNDELLDKVQRSLAILGSAHIMDYQELSMHISNLRLGLNLGYIDLPLDSIIKLEEKVRVKNSDFVTKSELISLADSVAKIIKGE